MRASHVSSRHGIGLNAPVLRWNRTTIRTCGNWSRLRRLLATRPFQRFRALTTPATWARPQDPSTLLHLWPSRSQNTNRLPSFIQMCERAPMPTSLRSITDEMSNHGPQWFIGRRIYLPFGLPPGFPALSPGFSAAGFAIAGPPIGLDCSPSFPLPLSANGAILFALQVPIKCVRVTKAPILVDATTPTYVNRASSPKRNPNPCAVSGGHSPTISLAQSGGATWPPAWVLAELGRACIHGSRIDPSRGDSSDTRPLRPWSRRPNASAPWCHEFRSRSFHSVMRSKCVCEIV